MKALCFALAFILTLSSATNAYAQAANHLVPLADLHSALAAKSAQREAHIAEIQTLLRHDAVQEKLGGLLDINKVETLISHLDDQTLSDLSSQSRRINEDIAAAGSTTWVIVGLAAAGAVIAILLAIRLHNE